MFIWIKTLLNSLESLFSHHKYELINNLNLSYLILILVQLLMKKSSK